MRGIIRIMAVIGALALLVASASAQTAVPVSTTTIDLGNLFGDASPYINALIASLVSLAVGWIRYEARVRYNVVLDTSAMNTLQTALTNGASSLVADGAVKLKGVSLDVHSQMLATAANDLVARNPDAMARFGLTPDKVATLIVDKLPHVPAVAAAQAQAIAATAAPATV